MLPHTVLVGKLVENPVVRTGKNKCKYANFSVACSHDETKNNPNPKVYYYNCNAWGAKSAFVIKNLKKGDEVAIVAELMNGYFINKKQEKEKFCNLNINKITVINKCNDQQNKLNQSTEIKSKKLAKKKLEEKNFDFDNEDFTQQLDKLQAEVLIENDKQKEEVDISPAPSSKNLSDFSETKMQKEIGDCHNENQVETQSQKETEIKAQNEVEKNIDSEPKTIKIHPESIEAIKQAFKDKQKEEADISPAPSSKNLSDFSETKIQKEIGDYRNENQVETQSQKEIEAKAQKAVEKNNDSEPKIVKIHPESIEAIKQAFKEDVDTIKEDVDTIKKRLSGLRGWLGL